MDSKEKVRQEIDTFIAAHKAWKQRLTEAARTGTLDAPVEVIEVDNQCALGKWLYAMPPEVRGRLSLAIVRGEHSEFHEEAGRIARLIEGGKTDEAMAEIEGGLFVEISNRLVGHLTNLKNVI